MFCSAVAQIGPMPVARGGDLALLEGDTLWGTVLVVWALVTASLDNVLRPLLIREVPTCRCC
jgi:hypothetical protein